MSCWVTKQRRLVVATVRSVISFSDMPAAAALALITARMRAPSTGPGRIAFTLTPSGPSSIESDLVRPITPHFAAEYGARRGNPKRPAAEDRLMIAPPPAARRNGMARRE